MTRAGSMGPLGIDLGTLEAPPARLDDAAECPGAALRVNHAMLAELRRGGEVFQSPKDPIPSNGMGTIRVMCRGRVGKLPNTASGHPQWYGLCHSCSALEADNRAALRTMAGAK